MASVLVIDDDENVRSAVTRVLQRAGFAVEAADSGLGFLINDSRFIFRTDRILLGMVVIGVMGLLMDRGLRLLSRLALPWYQAAR